MRSRALSIRKIQMYSYNQCYERINIILKELSIHLFFMKISKYN